MRTSHRVLAITLIGLAACEGGGVGDSVSSTSTQAPVVGNAVGPGISVGEALANDSGQPLLVNGYLFADTEGTVTLASEVAESFPPQPAGDQVVVQGLNLQDYELTESEGRAWTEDQIQVLGVLDGSTLHVSNTLSG